MNTPTSHPPTLLPPVPPLANPPSLPRLRSSLESHPSIRAKRMGIFMRPQPPAEAPPHPHSRLAATTPTHSAAESYFAPLHKPKVAAPASTPPPAPAPAPARRTRSDDEPDARLNTHTYIKRLLTLPEESRLAPRVARRLLLAFGDLVHTVTSLAGFSRDRRACGSLNVALARALVSLDALVEAMASDSGLLVAMSGALQAVRGVTASLSEALAVVAAGADKPLLRQVMLALYGTYAEMANVQSIVAPSMAEPSPDEKLAEALTRALAAAQTGFQQLTGCGARLAQEGSVPPAALQRVRDLMAALVAAQGTSQRLATRMERSGVFAGAERRRTLDEISVFLKAVVGVLGAAKVALPEVPVLLHETRPAMGALTKATKEVTLLWESSSTKEGAAVNPPPLSSIPSVAHLGSVASMGSTANMASAASMASTPSMANTPAMGTYTPSTVASNPFENGFSESRR